MLLIIYLYNNLQILLLLFPKLFRILFSKTCHPCRSANEKVTSLYHVTLLELAIYYYYYYYYMAPVHPHQVYNSQMSQIEEFAPDREDAATIHPKEKP